MTPRPAHIALLIAVVTVAACNPLREVVEDVLDSRSPRERYEDAIAASGLGEYAIARDWSRAAARALEEAPMVPASHVEEVYLVPAEPVALSYKVSARRGQRITFGVSLHGDTTALLFIEAWQRESQRDGSSSMQQLAVADSGARELVVRPRRDGEIIFRAQPEIARGGRLSVAIQVLPTLAFPVQGGHERDIGSVYGDPRDGGRRSHRGIDIFAPRGTPAIAAIDAIVHRVETTPVGGNVVWLRDENGDRLYYAHLDRQTVERGQRVSAGDTVGYVGNTGNARTTPPHLHFGIYSRGAVDPYWFVHTPRSTPPRLVADTTRLGAWARSDRAAVLLRDAPDPGASPLQELPLHTALRVVSAVGEWYRVRLPDGSSGYLPANRAESVGSAVATAELATDAKVLAAPRPMPTPDHVVGQASAGDVLDVIGQFGEFLLVRNGSWSGWIAQSAIAAQQ